MTPNLKKKIDRAIRLIRSVPPYEDEPLEVAYSGGKDSDVILELTRMSGVPYRAIYKSTTIDPPGTIAHAMRAGADILRPKRSFFQLIEANGCPSRFSRFCCKELKEYPVLRNVVIGVRLEESVARARRYREPVVCRVFNKRKDIREQQILPILDWTMEDEREFIQEQGITLHPHYYREDGTPDLTRRVGCMGCPLMSQRKRIEDFKAHPGVLRLYIKAMNKYLTTHPSVKTATHFQGSAWQWMWHKLHADMRLDDFKAARDGIVRLTEEDYREWFKNNFNI